MTSYLIDIRQRRQATFPSEVLKQLNIGVGDSLELELMKDKAVIRPKKQIALNALREIQEAFSKAKVKEEELQDILIKNRA